MLKKLTIPQLNRKFSKLVRVRDGLRDEARTGPLPGTVRLSVAKAADAINEALGRIDGEIANRRAGR